MLCGDVVVDSQKQALNAIQFQGSRFQKVDDSTVIRASVRKLCIALAK